MVKGKNVLIFPMNKLNLRDRDLLYRAKQNRIGIDMGIQILQTQTWTWTIPDRVQEMKQGRKGVDI